MATNALNNDFLLNIQSVYPSLTKAEKKVADYTLQNSKAVRFLSITDLAEACHVSLTSVFRFCKVLKLQGYQEFKVQLALSIQEEGQGEEIELLPAAVTKADSVPTAAKKLLQSHINALSETHALVDEAALSRAAHISITSDQVRFSALADRCLPAMEGMYNFCTLCQRLLLVRYPHADNGRLYAEPTRHRCFISHSGASKEIVQMAQKAHEGGAKTIAITKYAKSPLTEYMDVVLLCGGYEPPLQEGSFPSKTAQMFVLDLLFTEVYRTQFDYSKEINKRVTTSILDKDY